MLLVAAGLYQWTPLKGACLGKCRAPAAFLQAARAVSAATLPAPSSWVCATVPMCVGCCWPLMLLLFVGGVMNILWIAAITIFVLAEKLLPGGDRMGRAAGVLLVAAGLLARGARAMASLRRARTGRPHAALAT